VIPGDSNNEGAAPIAAIELSRLQQRSNARGLLRLAGHVALIAATGAVYSLILTRSSAMAAHALAATVYGFTLVTMFAAMHEAVHRTSFKSRWLNDLVAWFAGLLSFYNSTYYRPYHGWHHRFTQLAGRDPELEDGKPTSLTSYALEVSGLPWWIGKLRTHATLALGKTASYRFLTERTGARVVRSVRLQLLVYCAAIVASFALRHPYFVVYWLVPVALAQPILRVILLAEHTGCSEDDNPLTNTRTTRTVWLVRFLMWEMPYHAEHHYHPALPFFTLARAHRRIGSRLRHVAQGYAALHAGFLRDLAGYPAPER
jgi:fatty acid desaturase